MIRPFGESALLVELGDPRRAQALARSLRREPIAGVEEVVPGLDSLVVEIDPAMDGAVADRLRSRVSTIGDEPLGGKSRRIPVVYGGEHGPDLSEVARLCGLSEGDVIERHAGSELRVLFLGFAPGFGYLGDLPDELRVPRLATPRTSTPSGAVAIAEAMSGVYPAALPGGWRVIGRTPIVVFDARRDPPAYLAPGDVVTFEPIPPDRWAERAGVPDDWG